MLEFFLVSFALVFVLEGVLPFLSPRTWRHLMQQMMMQSDTALRVCGLMSMLIGLGLLYLVH